MGRAGEGVLGLTKPLVLWIPVAVAVLLQALLLFTSQPEIAYDSASYLAQAESLASTGKSLNARGEPDTIRTPGYPLFLSAFLTTSLGISGAIAAQRMLWVAAVAAVAGFTFRTTRSAMAAIFAGVVSAIDLPALQAAGSVLTETPAAVLVTVTVWQAYRAINARSLSGGIVAGLLAGCAALVRPVAILLGLPLALAALIVVPRESRVRVAASLLIASLILPAAWTVRNYAQTGVMAFSSISSVNLLLYRAAGTLAIRDPGGMDANIQRRQAELETEACRVVEARFGRECDAVPMAQRATVYSGIAMPIILGDPLATAMQAGRAFVMIVFGGGAIMLSRVTGMSESTARLVALAYTVPLALLAIAGVMFWWRIDRAAAALMVLTIGYMVLISLGVEAYSRFRVPFLPLYAMLAGGGAVALLSQWIPSHPQTK